MAIRFKRNQEVLLLPDEKLLRFHSTFRAISGLSIPNYRISFPWRGVCSFELRITTHRVLLVSDLFERWIQVVDMWFPKMKPAGETEILTSAAVRDGLFGRCLELKSRDPKRWKWLCSPNLTLRLFFENPEPLEAIISEAMKEQGSQPADGIRRPADGSAKPSR